MKPTFNKAKNWNMWPKCYVGVNVTGIVAWWLVSGSVLLSLLRAHKYLERLQFQSCFTQEICVWWLPLPVLNFEYNHSRYLSLDTAKLKSQVFGLGFVRVSPAMRSWPNVKSWTQIGIQSEERVKQLIGPKVQNSSETSARLARLGLYSTWFMIFLTVQLDFTQLHLLIRHFPQKHLRV